MPTWQIVLVRAGTRLNPGGQPIPTKIVRYTVAGHGPFETEFDASAFTPDAVKAALDKDAATFAQLNIPPAPGAAGSGG